MKNFNICINRLLKDEGGYTNDPNDSGGPTNFGITLADYRRYVNKNGVAVDVENMGVDVARQIYKTKYWDALNCDSLPSGVDYTAFDYAVNSGVGRPRKALQRFKSLSGTKLIDAINNERTAFLEALAAQRPKDKKFIKGWLTRVERVRAFSKQLAKKDYTGSIVGGGTGTVFISLSQYFHQHQTAIIIGGILLAVVIGTAVHIYKNKGK